VSPGDAGSVVKCGVRNGNGELGMAGKELSRGDEQDGEYMVRSARYAESCRETAN